MAIARLNCDDRWDKREKKELKEGSELVETEEGVECQSVRPLSGALCEGRLRVDRSIIPDQIKPSHTLLLARQSETDTLNR